MHTILANGTQVRCTNVDMFGLCGRDPHPTEEDVGFTGCVVGNTVERVDPDGYFGRSDDVAPGTETSEEDTVVYAVQDASGRVLRLASYEIEQCNSLVT